MCQTQEHFKPSLVSSGGMNPFDIEWLITIMQEDLESCEDFLELGNGEK
jgi:hypothetical protein